MEAFRFAVEGYGFATGEGGSSANARQSSVVKELMEAREDEDVRAVVLRFCERLGERGILEVSRTGEANSSLQDYVSRAVREEMLAVVYAGRIVKLDAEPQVRVGDLGLDGTKILRVVKRAQSESKGRERDPQIDSPANASAADVNARGGIDPPVSSRTDLSSAPRPERAECASVAVREITPNGCMTCGGVRVKVIGHGFVEGARVRFGRSVVPAVRHSHDLLVCTAPPHDPGVVSIEVERAPNPRRATKPVKRVSASNGKRRSSPEVEVYEPGLHDAHFTSDGISFTYIDIADLQGALALTCDSDSKKASEQTTCGTDELSIAQTPHGLS
mmetsp:Transcript_10252/g.27340  ORF Transcript_10252/g.27340 Transcript_10252/m.27340 type:complete len:331 (+) Transcript_10252:16-1008(+)